MGAEGVVVGGRERVEKAFSRTLPAPDSDAAPHAVPFLILVSRAVPGAQPSILHAPNQRARACLLTCAPPVLAPAAKPLLSWGARASLAATQGQVGWGAGGRGRGKGL